MTTPLDFKLSEKLRSKTKMQFRRCANCRWAAGFSDSENYANCHIFPTWKNVHKNHFCGQHERNTKRI